MSTETRTTAIVHPRAARRGSCIEQAAREVGVSPVTIRQVRKVDATGDAELIQAMEQYRISIAKAAQLAELPPAERPAALASAIADKPHRGRPPAGAGSTVDAFAKALAAAVRAGDRLPWRDLTSAELSGATGALGKLRARLDPWYSAIVAAMATGTGTQERQA